MRVDTRIRVSNIDVISFNIDENIFFMEQIEERLKKRKIRNNLHSLHKLRTDINQHFKKFQTAMTDKFYVDFSTLMEKFPGVHYNIACRSLCKNNDTIDYDDDDDIDSLHRKRIEFIRNRYPNN
jgi:hypothetical protein